MSVSLPVVALRAPHVASALLGRRLARIGFGVVLALSPVVVATAWAMREDSSLLTTAPLIALVWLAAFAVAAVIGRFGRSAAALAFADAHDFAVASYVVPAIGVGVAGPLSLHALVGLPLWTLGVLTDDHTLVGAFDSWVGLSLFGTAHAHLAFVIAMGVAARRFAAGDVGASVRLWPAVVLSIMPGIVILFPPFLVLATGALVEQAFLAAARAWRQGDLEAATA